MEPITPPVQAPPSPIATTVALESLCAELAGEAFITVDTEFIRETTYFAKLCLIQVAGKERLALIDPLAEGLDLAPFFALLRNPRVLKVFHAPRQDLEIFFQANGAIPSPIFDTQVAAMVCGYGEQASYETLASSLAGARIDKSSRFTDWAQRPLTAAQLAYAAADVTHLRIVYERLRARIDKSARESWLAEEMAILTDPATYVTAPEDAWQRIKSRLRKPAERAALIELAAWREREAQARNVPRGRILKDDAIVELALSRPKTAAELARLRALPGGFERSRLGEGVLGALKAAALRDPETLPELEADRPNGSGALGQILKVLLGAASERHQVAARLIASSADIDRLAADPAADLPVLKGWRRAVFGEVALQIIRGEALIGIEKGRIRTYPRNGSPD